MEAILLVLALSLDAFVASMAYGINKIKVPFTSMIIIDIVCSMSLALSIFFATFLRKVLPHSITSMISFLILMIIGIYYLFESLVKANLQKKARSNQKVKLRFFNIWFIIEIYIDETKADMDNSKTLNSKESLYLATALSLDSLAIGFGSGLGSIHYFHVILLSLIFHIFAIWGGLHLGKKFSKKSKINLSWLAGILLIILAILKLV